MFEKSLDPTHSVADTLPEPVGFGRRFILWGGVVFAFFGFQLSHPAWCKESSTIEANEDARSIMFGRDVKPILREHCFKCHGNGRSKGELNMDTRESLLRGSESGRVVELGRSQESLLIELVSGPDPDMPPEDEGDPLSEDQVSVLTQWIDQGVDWSEEDYVEPYQLALKPVTLPDGEGHPIDRIISDYFKQNGIKPAKPVEDGVFARRVFLDIIGLLPSQSELQAFEADSNPEKRMRLVSKLLEEHSLFVGHWMSFWMDHLRIGSALDSAVFDNNNTEKPLQWLEERLKAGDTIDDLVRNILTGEFLDWYATSIAPKGEVATAQGRPEMQSAHILSQVFLGVRLQCASCHDSFVDRWKLSEAWGLASALSVESLEMSRCEVRTGEIAEPRFLFPELGEIDQTLGTAGRRTRLAELMVSPRNGLLPRTMVNRLWARLLGRGLIEPVDEMIEHKPWNAALLEWLAAEFVRQDYDLKKLIELIVTSKAYQLPAGKPITKEKKAQASKASLHEGSSRDLSNSDFVFYGPLPRRLTAEQIVDSLDALASPEAARQARSVERAWQQPNDALMRALGRPDRNVVVTQRSGTTSPLQSLELMNSERLEELVTRAATTLVSQEGNSTGALVETVYRHLLGRRPSNAELRHMRKAFGRTLDERSVADLLWVIVMKPEFQLIR